MSGWWLTALGSLMVVCSLGAKIVGLPQQIMYSYRTKTAPQALRWFMWLAVMSYSTQLAYNAALHVWLTALAAAPGVVLTGIIVWQLHAYQPVSDYYTSIDDRRYVVCRGVNGTYHTPWPSMQELGSIHPLSLVSETAKNHKNET